MIMTKIKLHPAYQPLFREQEKRYFMLTGGRGSGKSYALSLFLCQLSTKEKQVVLYTRYTLTSAHISIIPEFIDKIESLGLSDQFEISKSEIIHKITGSRIIFRGIRTSSGNQTAALKSIQGVTTWVLDEGEEMPDEATFDKIDESVREKGVQNRIIVALNPAHTSHWIYKRWFENGQQPDTCYIHTTYKNNSNNLSQSFLDRAESVRVANEKKYQHRFLGEWMNAAEGVVFDNWTTGEFDHSLALQCFGQDYGFSEDPTTLIKVAIDKKKKILYLHDCFALPGLSTSKIAELNKKYAEHELIIADSAEPRLIDELEKEHKINIKGAVKGPGSITAGITSMQDYDIVVTPESHNLIKELRNYVYLDKGSKVYIDDYNHSIDAARYAFQFLTKGQVESWTIL